MLEIKTKHCRNKNCVIFNLIIIILIFIYENRRNHISKFL